MDVFGARRFVSTVSNGVFDAFEVCDWNCRGVGIIGGTLVEVVLLSEGEHRVHAAAHA